MAQVGNHPAVSADGGVVHRPAEVQIQGGAAGVNLLLAQCRKTGGLPQQNLLLNQNQAG
jgi:hypothetical protein